MALLGTLQVRLGLDTGLFTRRITSLAGDAQRQTARITQSFAGLGKVKGILAGVFAGVSAAAFADMIRGATDTLDAMGEVAQRLGLTTGKLQEYRIAAKFAGVESQGLDKSLGFLAKNLGNIRNGLDVSGQRAGLLESLGLSQKDIRGADVGTVFEQVVSGLSRIPDPATRSATAIALFGKSAGELGILFEQGAEGLAKSRQLITDLGIGLTDLDTSRAGELNDNFDKLGLIIDGVKTKLASELTPILTRVTADLIKSGTEGQNFGSRISSGVMQAAVAVDTFLAAGRLIGNIFGGAFNLVRAGVAGLAGAFTYTAGVVIDALGTKAPEALNSLLSATESGLTRMKQGFADFATAAANFVVGSMNKAIEAIEKLVNFTAESLNGLIRTVNGISGSNFAEMGSVALGRIGSFDRFPVEATSLGRVGTFGQGAAAGLQGASKDYFGYSQEALQALGGNVKGGVGAANQLLNGGEGYLAKSLRDAATGADQLTTALGGDSPSGTSPGGTSPSGGGGGGAAGAMERLGTKAKETGEEMKRVGLKVQNVWEDAMQSIGSAIDEFVKTGKLNFRDLVNDIVASMASAAIKNAINSTFGAIAGALGGGTASGSTTTTSGGGWGNVFGAVLKGFTSYEGGGYTGSGARSGGMDGRGGRLAMIHPNETVIDHERVRGTGRRGGRPQVNLSVPINLQPGVSRQELAAIMPILKRDIIETIPRLLNQGGRYASNFGV